MENSSWQQIINIPELQVVDVDADDKVLRLKCNLLIKKAVCPDCKNVCRKINQYIQRK